MGKAGTTAIDNVWLALVLAVAVAVFSLLFLGMTMLISAFDFPTAEHASWHARELETLGAQLARSNAQARGSRRDPVQRLQKPPPAKAPPWKFSS